MSFIITIPSFNQKSVILHKIKQMIKIGNIELPDFPLLLAPMEDVSDSALQVVKCMCADMMYSEFISSEGLIRDAIKSRMKLDIFDMNASSWHPDFLEG
jgi:hypothetical protein